jgi:hypothetical protein
VVQRLGDRQDILVLLHDHDAADHFSGSIEVDRTAPEVIPRLHVTDIFQEHRLPVLPADEKMIQLGNVFIVENSAQLIFTIRDFNRAASDFLKRSAHGANYVIEGYALFGKQWRETV